MVGLPTRNALHDIAKVLNGPSQPEADFWAIMIIGLPNCTWRYIIVSIPSYVPYSELENYSTNLTRFNLEQCQIYPSFIKMKSFTLDENIIETFKEKEKSCLLNIN